MKKIKRMIRRAQNNPLSKWNTFLNFINKNNRKFRRFRESQSIRNKEFLTQLEKNIKINSKKIKTQLSKYKKELAKFIAIKKDERLKLAQIKTKERIEKEKIQTVAKQEKAKIDEQNRIKQQVIADQKRMMKQMLEQEKQKKQQQIDEQNRIKQQQIDEQNRMMQQKIEEQNRIKQQQVEAQSKSKQQEIQEKQEIKKVEIQSIEQEQQNLKRKEKKSLNYEIKRERHIRNKEFIERKVRKMKDKINKIIVYIKRKIKSRRVLTLDTSMPKEITVEYAPKSYVSESFRTLRTNIQFMNANKNIKSVLVNSTMPGEGKSYVSANLAATFAQADKRVVIVDSDMRKGRLHEIFKVTKNPGLSNYLSGVGSKNSEIANVNEFIYKTAIHNLFIMPMGNTPPNPSELIASENMVKLIKELKENFDVVIFDGTPSKIVTDSVILSREVDTTLVVTGHNKTRMEDLKKVQKDIENVGGNIAGVVINSVPINTKKYASSYYYENLEGERKKVKKMFSL